MKRGIKRNILALQIYILGSCTLLFTGQDKIIVKKQQFILPLHDGIVPFHVPSAPQVTTFLPVRSNPGLHAMKHPVLYCCGVVTHSGGLT